MEVYYNCHECAIKIDHWQSESHLGLCETCYEKMFESLNNSLYKYETTIKSIVKEVGKMKFPPIDDEEDFVLGSEVAEMKLRTPDPSEMTSLKFIAEGDKVLDVRQNGDIYVDGVKAEDYAVIGEAFCRWATSQFKL